MAAGYNSADGKIYLNGGFETSTIDSVQATTWKYDPVANSFTVLDARARKRTAGTASGIINGHFLVAGGRTNPDETLVATWDYDIASDTWTQKQDMPQPTNVPGSAVALSKLWAFGGCTTDSVQSIRRDCQRRELRSRREHVVDRAEPQSRAIVPRGYGGRQHAVRRGRP